MKPTGENLISLSDRLLRGSPQTQDIIDVGVALKRMAKRIATDDRCPVCDASTKRYWHKLTPLLVKSLVEFYRAVSEKGENELHIPKDVDFTKTQYNNFQKLRFHGLVAKVKDKRGYWLMTRRGGEFVRGEIEIPEKVQTFRNRVVDHSSKLIKVGDVLGSTPYVQEEF